jgi:hypothetical protein
MEERAIMRTRNDRDKIIDELISENLQLKRERENSAVVLYEKAINRLVKENEIQEKRVKSLQKTCARLRAQLKSK